MCPNGLAILQDSVKRRFPADDTWVEWDHPRAFQYESTVADLIQEIVQRHATGIEFREYNVSLFSASSSRTYYQSPLAWNVMNARNSR